MSKRPLATGAILLTLGLIAAGTQDVNGAPHPADTRYTLELTVDQISDDTDASVNRFADLLALAPTRLSTVTPGQTVSGIIVDTYGFGRSNFPRIYALLEARILELNHLTDATALQTSVIAIPNLPKLGYTNPNTFNKTVPYSVLLSGEDLFTSVQGYIAGPVTKPIAVPPQRLAAETKIITYQVTQEQLTALAKTKAFHHSTTLRTIDTPLELQFADAEAGTGTGVYPVLTDDDRVAITQALTRATRQSLLVIADSGFPKEAYDSSRAFLESTLDRLRAAGGLSTPPWTRPPYSKPLQPHCEEVYDSIRELLSLDTNNKITVVFVPLLPVQASDDIFRSLIELAEAERAMGDSWGKIPLPDTKRNQITANADFIMGQLRERLAETTAEVTATHGYSRIYNVPAYLDDIWHTAGYAALERKAHFFLSQSWTVFDSALNIGYTKPPGFLVCAAGNQPQTDFYANEIDFADRCVHEIDTVCVLNLKSNNATLCESSSTLGTNYYATAKAIAFNGSLVPTDCGATSFATPRVAWLLALADAQSNADKDGAPYDWLATNGIKILRARRNGNGDGQLGLDISKLLANP